MNDLRLAVQSLRRSPGFTLVAIVTLALGIGANTSMFSVASAYMLQPAPYPESHRLERIYRVTPQNTRGGFSPADSTALIAEGEGYGEVAAYGVADMSVAEPGKPAEMVAGIRTTANLFTILGARPPLGRIFRPDEETLGHHRVLVISDRYWHHRFGGDPRIVGRTVRVDGEPHEIVGVLPPDFSDWRHLWGMDLYRPLGLKDEEVRDRTASWVRLVGRRAPNIPRARAAAFVAEVGRRRVAENPPDNVDVSWRTMPLDVTLVPTQARGMLLMLVGLSAFVVFIACSNLANLLLTRTMARARELAVRAALGASRARMLRPLFVESLVLALAGGAGAVVLARWSADWMERASLNDYGVGITVDLDWRVLGWTFGACLFTAVLFGVAPALFTLRLDPNRTLKSGSRGATGDRGHQRFRQVLIVGQFALAMVLLAGAGVFVHGLHTLNERRYGWQSEQLVTGVLSLPEGRYTSTSEIAAFQRTALARLEALPGVASAGMSYSMPFFRQTEQRRVVVSGREAPPAGKEPAALINGVSPRYFETVGTRLLRGRAFTAADDATAPRVFVINETMARGLFGEEDPIGRRIAAAGGTTPEWGEIVGVVGDVLSIFPDPGPVTYQLYLPMAQEPRALNQIAVRTAGLAPAALVDDIRATLAAVDPDLPVRRLQPADATVRRANYGLGVLRSLFSSLAVLGLGLACLGVYGVVARTVAQRTGEFGIRLALGAQAADILRLVLTSGARLALIGSALGLAGAFGVTRLLASAFPALPMNTAAVLIGVAVLLVGVAQLACYLPARHAARINPTEALRAE